MGARKDELDTALGFFQNSALVMRCYWFRSRGLFVGSGAVEAGCKAVIGQGPLPDLLLRAAVGQAGPGRGGFRGADVGG
jgi:hypothetical protein